MRKIYGSLVLGLLAFSSVTLAQVGTTVSVGDFSYVDLTAGDAGQESLHRINETEFGFLLAETLLAMSAVAVVAEHRADYRVIGRVTRLNTSGDARIELAFLQRGQFGQSIAEVEDRVLISATLSDADDAMLGLLQQTRESVVSFLAPKPDFDLLETIATR